MLREAFVLLLIQRILSFEKLSIDSSSTSTPVRHITPVQHIAFIHCIICLPVQNLPHDSVCPDSCRPPRKNMTLYFHISMFRHNFCSCPVRLVLSYCIQTSPYLIPTPVVVNVQHPQSKTQCRHHSYNVIKAQQKCPPDHKSKSQVHVLCTFSSSSSSSYSFLSACPHVPTHLPLLHQTQHSQHQLRA